MRGECGKNNRTKKKNKKKKERNIERLNLQVKNRPWHDSRVSRERAGSASCISHYIHMTPVFLLAGKRFPLVSLPFRTLCEVLFERPPQCPTISVCPFVNLSRSFSRLIDHRTIDRSIICSLFLFIARSLRLFNRLFSVRVSFARSFLSLYSLSRAEVLYGTRGDLREIRPYFAIVRYFTLLLLFVSHSSRTSHTTSRIVQLVDFPAPLYARFVYLSFDDRIVSSASTPSTSFTLHPRLAPPTRIFFHFLFNKTVL